MTYEEMVNAKGGYSAQAAKTPFGVLSKKQTDGKFHDVLTIDSQWTSIPAFLEGLKNDCLLSEHLRSKQQLHYIVREDDNQHPIELEFESGSYQTLEHVLDAAPSLVAQSAFVEGIVMGLNSIMVQLHEKSVFHLCFSPRNVFIRKGDNMPMLLLHGSAFWEMKNPLRIFEGNEDFLAPELKNGGEPSVQCDIYSFGKLVEWLFRQSNLPYEYKRMVAKAVRVNPDERYDTVTKMAAQLESMRSKKRSIQMFVGALIIALVCIGLYFEFSPQASDREFIEAAPKGAQTNIFEDGFDPEYEAILSGDSTDDDTLTAEEQHTLDEYMKKAENIFRRRFAEKADGVLSKVYNSESMNETERTFVANSSAMSEELIQLQSQLATEAGITSVAAERIAAEEVSRIIAEKEELMEKEKEENNQ